MSAAPNVQTDSRLRQRTRIRLTRLLPVCLLVLLAASGAIYFRVLIWGNNLHVVVPGEVYRSAQPSTEQLDRYITRLGLRTVVSLRGGKNHWPWFVAERELCASRGVHLYAVHFEPDRLPPKGELERLVEILASAPRPILMHCSQGIDRSGLGAAVALLMAGQVPEQAASQFSLKYGFVAAAGHSDLPQILSEYEDWLQRSNRAHAPAAFRQWVFDVYLPYYYLADIRLCPGCPEDPQALTEDRAIAPNTWEVAPDETLRLHVQIANRSPQPWHFRSTMHHGVHLGMIVDRVDGAASAHEQPRNAAPTADHREFRTGYQDMTVAPGQTVNLHAEIPPLETPGRYRVTVDLVDESVTWFADMGSPPLQFELRVRDKSVAGL